MNKYKDKSKVNEYEKYDLVEKCNAIDFGFTGKVKHIQCLKCRNACPDLEFNLTGACIHYKERMSLREINEQIRKQNINVKRLCSEFNLKYFKMKDMLNNKMIMKFKYYKPLEKRICEKMDDEKEYKQFMKAIEEIGGLNVKQKTR